MFVSVISSSVFPQPINIDSLTQVLKITKNDSSKAEILVQLGYAYNTFDEKKTIAYYIEALNLFQDKIDVHRKGVLLNKIGFHNWQLGNYLETIDYYKEALSIFTQLKDVSLIAKVENNLAATYWGLGNYNDALELYQKALKIRIAEKDYRGISVISNNVVIGQNVSVEGYSVIGDNSKIEKNNVLKDGIKINVNSNIPERQITF